MICSVKPVLTEDLCVVQKNEFSKHVICAKYTLDERSSVFLTDPSSRQRGCYIRTITAKVRLEKTSGHGPQGV
jgi:hypothetical protein